MGALFEMATEKNRPIGEIGKKGRRRKPAVPLDGSVKVTLDIKEKLEEVAKDMKLYPGELIEQKMGGFLTVESLRIRTMKLEQAKKAAKGN